MKKRKTSESMVPISVFVAPDVIKKLDRIASGDREISRSVLIRKAIGEYLLRYQSHWGNLEEAEGHAN